MNTRYVRDYCRSRLAPAAGAVVVAVLLARALTPGYLPDDLAVYQGATRDWLAGGDLYAFRRPNGDGFSYPPAAAVLLLWTAALPDPTLAGIWVAGTVAAVGLAAAVLARRTGASGSGAFFILLAAAPGRSNLDFGQVSVLVFALTVMDACWSPRHAQGWLTGVAAAIKVTPMLFIVMFAVRRQWAALARSLAACMGMTAAAAVVDPGVTRRYFSQGLLGVAQVTDWDGPGNQSLRAMFSRCGAGGPGWVIAAAAVVLAALTWTARRRRHELVVADWCVVGIAITLASPISWTHHRYWVLAPLLLAGVWRQPVRRWLRRLLLVAAFVGPVALLGAAEIGVIAAVATGVAVMTAPGDRHPHVVRPRDRIGSWRQ